MSEPIIGEIRLFPTEYCPEGWLRCSGQLLSVSEYSALFSVIGATYGGDGRRTFAIPDLERRVAVGSGAVSAPDRVSVALGKTLGAPSVALSESTLPRHSHVMEKKKIAGSSTSKTSAPSAKSDLGQLTSGAAAFATFAFGDSADTHLDPKSLAPTGGGGAHENQQPFLCVFFAIAYTGEYPIRP